jgi:hypothetical protein
LAIDPKQFIATASRAKPGATTWFQGHTAAAKIAASVGRKLRVTHFPFSGTSTSLAIPDLIRDPRSAWEGLYGRCLP